MTIVAISQPMYFPWVGFIEMMRLADVFIWLDDAQFSKGSFTNRIQVKTPVERKWMTIPLMGKGTFDEIRDLRAAKDFRASHRDLLRASLTGGHVEAALALFDTATAQDGLCDLLIASAEGEARTLDALPPRILRASEMNVVGESWQRVIDLVKAVGGTHYISGAGGARYLDHNAFEAQGLSVAYMAYNPKPWPQGHGDFTPFVTALDLIAARGADGAEHLRPQTVPWRDRLAELENTR